MSQATDPGKAHERLGERDPLSILSETPSGLARLVQAHPAGEWRARPFEGRWTPNEVLGHMSDAEWAFGWRTRSVLGDQEPAITRFDQDGWVAAQRLDEREPAELLEMFGQLRRWNLAVWTRLQPKDLERAGISSKRGRVSLRRLIRAFAEHDLHHLDQIRRYLETAKAPG